MFAPAKADARRRGDPAALPVYLFRSGSTEGAAALRCPKPNHRSGQETCPQAFAFLRRVPLNDAAGYRARFAARVQRFPARFERGRIN